MSTRPEENHDPLVDSTPGYIYLLELLASHGIIAASIDVNFLNGWNWGENDARAIVHLEHVKTFRAWNSTAHHPLAGKIDLTRVMIVGRSRGGEGVGHASYFNRLTSIQPTAISPVVPLDGSVGLRPYGFEIAAVMAIAPTDAQYVPVTGLTVVPDAYSVACGSSDLLYHSGVQGGPPSLYSACTCTGLPSCVADPGAMTR